jgi:ATP-dependent DNA helicase RecG
MVRAMRQAQMSPPKLEDHRTHFRVVFSNDTMLDDATIEWLNQFASLDLHENQRLALAYTRHQGEISNSIYCRLTGVDSRQATLDLQELVARGMLQQTGTRRWTTYRLPTQFFGKGEEERSPAGVRNLPADERLEQIYQFIAARGQVSARAIREEFHLSKETLRSDLRRLAKAGRIERSTAHPRDKRAEYRIAGSESQN